MDYVAEWNHNCFVAVQIETAEGLANVDEIAAVPGIGTYLSYGHKSQELILALHPHSDMLFIGPNDLTSSLGFPFHLHPTLPESQEAFKQVLAAARKHNKFAGMFCTSADGVRKAWEQGC